MNSHCGILLNFLLLSNILEEFLGILLERQESHDLIEEYIYKYILLSLLKEQFLGLGVLFRVRLLEHLFTLLLSWQILLRLDPRIYLY